MAKLWSRSMVHPKTLPPNVRRMPPSAGCCSATKALLQSHQGDRGLGRLAALVLLFRVRADECLRFVFHGKDAIADGNPVHRQRHDTSRRFARDDLEVISLA